jgi:hypothetical protein
MICFSGFDLREGYYNLAVEEESQDLLAFKTTEGLYAPTVMPFGPTNCPAAMQRFMNHVFAPLYAKYNHRFKNYMDDCLIATGPGEDDLHTEITLAFFNILRDNSLFLKLSKCTFCVPEINFLGLWLTQTGVTIDPGKVSAIRDWPRTPKNLKELRLLLGVLGYQQPFILNFAKIARPVMALLKANAEFIWTNECKATIDLLINIVTSSPVLVALDQDCQFELEVDASRFALGGILWQRDPASPKLLHAVGFFSSTLSPAERNYSIRDRELLAVIRSLHHWSHLLRGTVLPVIIWTDHKNLTYWAEPHKVGPRTATWQVELTQYNFKLHHKPGESNKADLLSRRPNYNTGNASNDHLIVLPLSHFANMSPDLLATFQPNSLYSCWDLRTLP